LQRKINTLTSGRTHIKKVQIQPTYSNNLLQKTDMISGAVDRSFKGGKKKNFEYRKLTAHREIYVQLLSK